ncbi:MAG: hypothetical protein ACI81T_001426 [Bacteroidia bacterium]
MPRLASKANCDKNSNYFFIVSEKPKNKPILNTAKLMITVNALLATLVGFYFFLSPAFISLYYVMDSSFEKNEIPQFAYNSHKNISPRFEKWATDRLQQKLALETNRLDVISNEWPLFSAYWYLQASLQIEQELKKIDTPKEELPSYYAKSAIESAIRIITDKNHGNFAEAQWGDDYLTKENVYYRTMLIGGIATHHQLTRKKKYLELLKKQSNGLLAEIDASEHGLLHDFPEEIYPGDMLLALSSIKQADTIFGVERDSVYERAKRGFLKNTDSFTDLPPYHTSQAILSFRSAPSLARGSSTALLLHSAPNLWEEVSETWMNKFEEYYWLENWTAIGFREYPKGTPAEESQQWFWDVDAGPVLAGHGFTASVFGCGASRKNGRYDLAYPLATEMILLSYPLLNGGQLIAESLSDSKHAPLVGQIGILYNLACVSKNSHSQPELKIPPLFWIVFSVLILVGVILIWRGIRRTRRGRDLKSPPKYLAIQFVLWALLIALSVYLFSQESYWLFFTAITVSRFFPMISRE